MSHEWMMLVLDYVVESGSAVSGDVALDLGISSKHAGMTLLRCFRRGFLSRRSYKCGRVRGYVYEITSRGVEWLEYKASQRRKVQNEVKPALEVENEIINPRGFQTLILEQKPQTDTDYLPIIEALVIDWLMKSNYDLARDWLIKSNYDLARKCKSLENSLNLALIVIGRRNSELAYCFSLYLDLQKKYEHLLKSQQGESLPSSKPHIKGRWEGSESYEPELLKLGIQIGRTGAQFQNLCQTKEFFLKKKLAELKKAKKLD